MALQPVTTVTIVSCRQREASRRSTVAQLTAAGLTPVVVLSDCNPASDEGMTLAAEQAATVALFNPGGWLFCEDDIDLAPDFAWHLAEAVRRDAITYLYLNDSRERMTRMLGDSTTNRILAQRPIQRGPYELLERTALFGTQCVFIPERLKSAVAKVMTEPRRIPEPPDGRLHLWLNHAGAHERVFTSLPHPVQHRQERAGRGWTARLMRSFSYGVPYLLDDGSPSHEATPRPFDTF